MTQITSGSYKFRHMAQITKHAMQQIDTFENKWKISTNKSKFTTYTPHTQQHRRYRYRKQPLPIYKQGENIGAYFFICRDTQPD